MKHIYTSIDLGTDSIKVVVCELYKNKLNLLAASSEKSEGIKKGLITDVELAKASLKKAVSSVESMLGIALKQAIVSVPSYFLDCSMVKGSVDIPMNINEDDALDDELDKISDEFESWAHFYEAEAPAHRASSLQTTLNIGGEYTMWEDRVGFGLLSSTRFSAPRTWTELMASVNFRPINSLNLTLTGTVSNSGANWGWVLNFCPRSLNFFIGTDKMIGKVTPQFVPVGNLNFNLNFGFSVALGGPAKWARKAEKGKLKDTPTVSTYRALMD